ncbi:alcohol dehydrogenase catalytic domain-containing protein [Pseudomonas sp. S2_H01]
MAFQASPVNTSGHFPTLVGVDGVGRVIAVGGQIENVRVGDRVFIPQGVHTWRQRLVVAADGLYALPRTIDPRHLAMLLRRPSAAVSGGARSNSLDFQLRSLRRKIALVVHGRLKMPAPKVFPLWRIAEAVEEVRGGARVLLDLQAAPRSVQENQARWRGFQTRDLR